MPTRTVVIVSCLMLLASCGGGEATTSAPSSTTNPSTSGPTTRPLTTSTRPATTTTSTPPAAPGPPALVLTDSGVQVVSDDGSTRMVLVGEVAAAVDDTMGGLLFQRHRGRGWHQDSGEPAETAIWWLPAGNADPQELVVPTSGSDQWLTLHDASATDGGFAVLYTRHDGSTPFEDVVDHLRRLDVATGAVTELWSMGAWEQGFGDVTTGGGRLAGTWYGQLTSGCFILDMDGTRLDIVPALANPVTDERHVGGCRLGPDGTTLAFSITSYEDDAPYGRTTIHVWDLAADRELHRIDVAPELGRIGTIDTTGAWLLVNRTGDDGPLPALVWSLDDPSAPPFELPIAGPARLLTSEPAA